MARCENKITFQMPKMPAAPGDEIVTQLISETGLETEVIGEQGESGEVTFICRATNVRGEKVEGCALEKLAEFGYEVKNTRGCLKAATNESGNANPPPAA